MHTEKVLTVSTPVDMPWERANELEGIRTNCPPATRLKRKHDSPNDKLPDSQENGGGLHNEVKRLRRESQEKDHRLKQLERIITHLKQAISQSPVRKRDPQPTQATPSSPRHPGSLLL
jgi:chromosome segregation ATPase